MSNKNCKTNIEKALQHSDSSDSKSSQCNQDQSDAYESDNSFENSNHLTKSKHIDYFDRENIVRYDTDNIRLQRQS